MLRVLAVTEQSLELADGAGMLPVALQGGVDLVEGAVDVVHALARDDGDAHVQIGRARTLLGRVAARRGR